MDLTTNLAEWAAVTKLSPDEVSVNWQDLVRRGLASVEQGTIKISPLAMRRANTDAQRQLAAHVAGYLLTENSYIVRRAGDPPGLPCILNTRITVEQIAIYFKDGSGVTDIERDLPVLTRAEIEAEIQYYLNHRAEIEHDLRHSRELYAAN